MQLALVGFTVVTKTLHGTLRGSSAFVLCLTATQSTSTYSNGIFLHISYISGSIVRSSAHLGTLRARVTPLYGVHLPGAYRARVPTCSLIQTVAVSVLARVM
jgi:hypothetical protein